jgi:hypothetical protein
LFAAHIVTILCRSHRIEQSRTEEKKEERKRRKERKKKETSSLSFPRSREKKQECYYGILPSFPPFLLARL